MITKYGIVLSAMLSVMFALGIGSELFRIYAWWLRRTKYRGK